MESFSIYFVQLHTVCAVPTRTVLSTNVARYIILEGIIQIPEDPDYCRCFRAYLTRGSNLVVV